MQRVAFWISVLVALICVVVVVVNVVITGRDGTVANWSAVLAVAALVVSWRLYGHAQPGVLSD